jgi:RimJ/RimL family protein N-acetyltransferase
VIQVTDKLLVLEFMCSRLNLRATEDFQGTMFIHDEHAHAKPDMKLVGVAYAWHSFIGRICLINIVVQDKRVLTRQVIREAFRYPFEVAGCEAVLALVDSSNKESMSLCERTGFEVEHRITNGGLEGDLVFWQMTKDRCPWLKESSNG